MLNRARDSLLCDYTNRKSCFINGPHSPTTARHTHNGTPDVLDIVIVKDFVQPVNLSVCSAFSSDYLPILIDTTCRSSFQNLMDRPDFARMD
jgi:hypothetical protein